MLTPKLTAEEVGLRMLKLIDGIRSADDIAPENVEKMMGMKVEFNDQDRNEYGFGEMLTDAWAYNVMSLPETDGSKPKRLMLSFNDQTSADADMAPVCGLDFDAYSRALLAAGFKSEPQRGEHGLTISVQFTRGSVSVDLSTSSESEANPDHACVSLLIITV